MFGAVAVDEVYFPGGVLQEGGFDDGEDGGNAAAGCQEEQLRLCVIGGKCEEAGGANGEQLITYCTGVEQVAGELAVVNSLDCNG